MSNSDHPLTPVSFAEYMAANVPRAPVAPNPPAPTPIAQSAAAPAANEKIKTLIDGDSPWSAKGQQAKHHADALLESDYFELKCAHCTSTDMHHHRVIVRDRFTEDGAGAITTIDNGNVNYARTSDKGPLIAEGPFLGRRSDLSILLWCEHCHLETDLQIRQHKGKTYLRTRKTDAPPCDPHTMKF